MAFAGLGLRECECFRPAGKQTGILRRCGDKGGNRVIVIARERGKSENAIEKEPRRHAAAPGTVVGQQSAFAHGKLKTVVGMPA